MQIEHGMNKEILRLSIPNIISNITTPIVGIVGTYIAGHLSNTEYIGAVGLASTLFMVIYMAFSFLRMSTSGFTAQAFGANNIKLQTNILLRALVVAVVGGIVIITLQYPIGFLGFHFMNGTTTLKQYAWEYFSIYIWAAPAILITSTLMGWYVGMQNARYPMVISIIVNVVNIGFSLLFVIYFEMQIEGLAYATLISQYIGLGFGIILFSLKYKYIISNFSLKAIRSLKDYILFFRVNTDIFLRTMLLASVTTFFTSKSAKMGSDIFGANIILMQFFFFFSYVIDGFAFAAEALTGKYVGETNNRNLKKVVYLLFIWGIIFVAIFTIIYLLWGAQISRLLTDNQDIIPHLEIFRMWIILIPLAGFAAFLWDGIFIGATASAQMRNSMFYAVVVFFISYMLLSDKYQNHALWFSFILFLAVRGMIQTVMWNTIFGKISKFRQPTAQ